MRDFARYVILSPAMCAMAAPAVAHTIPLDQNGNAFRESGVVDQNATLGWNAKPTGSNVERRGPFIRPPHVAS